MKLYLKNNILFILLFTSIFAITVIPVAYSQSDVVTAKSIGFEETTIIEFKNNINSNSEIDTFRIWLGSDSTFKSFKTERGWTGQKTAEGLIVFTTSNPIKPGEIVKFGVKTDKPKPGINWKALSENNQELAIGKTLVSDSASTETIIQNSDSEIGVLESSIFRLIPEKPNVGSSMRVTGEKFAPNHSLDFYIGSKKIQSFVTNEDGGFIITSSIPSDLTADRVDFKIIDSQKNEKAISLRLGEETGVATTTNIPLTINPSPSVVYVGQTVKVTGTGPPAKTLTATIKDEGGNVLTTIPINVDLNGKWEYDRIIAPDTTLGKRNIELTDGVETLFLSWTIESSKKIDIVPIKQKFEPGETIVFNGTAKPNENLEIIVEDPLGTEFFSQVLNVDSSGIVNLQFTTNQASLEGTYVVFASQGEDIEIIVFGLGEAPEEKIIVKTDKLNYSTSDKAILDIKAPPSVTISLLIVDPADKNKFTDTIIFDKDGQIKYELDLKGYGSGVYTVVLTRGNSQVSEVFSVGLQTGSGDIDARTTKNSYNPGESILILGNSAKNMLLTVELRDPDGNVVKTKDTFTNKDGIFSLSSFKIPIDAKIGTWTVHARSGANFDEVKISVQGKIEDGLVIYVDKITSDSSGRQVIIKGYGAAVSQNVVMTIFDKSDVKITELTARTTSIGEFGIPWVVPSDVAAGTYKLKAKDPVSEAELTFDLK